MDEWGLMTVSDNGDKEQYYKNKLEPKSNLSKNLNEMVLIYFMNIEQRFKSCKKFE